MKTGENEDVKLTTVTNVTLGKAVIGERMPQESATEDKFDENKEEITGKEMNLKIVIMS